MSEIRWVSDFHAARWWTHHVLLWYIFDGEN
jgi:hypothetical protein